MMSDLSKRYQSNGVCCDAYDRCYNCYSSPWDNWGRWVALVAIIVAVILLAVVFSCRNSRRRRSQGLAPRYGTGWLAGKTLVGDHNGPQYTGNYYGGGGPGPAAPPYSPPLNNHTTGNTFNSNEGYYGQQSGVELQQPNKAYVPPQKPYGGEPVYSAPAGPPPGKGGYSGGGYNNDGIVR